MSYLLQSKNPLLCLAVCDYLEHALVIALDDAVRRLGILADVSVVCFDLAAHFPYGKIFWDHKLIQTCGGTDTALWFRDMLIKLKTIMEADSTASSLDFTAERTRYRGACLIKFTK